MPLINVRLIKNVFPPEQKQQITRDLTEAVASRRAHARRDVVRHRGSQERRRRAIGGQPATTRAVRALARGDLSLPV
jgi:4-oxalocrotonate tautomerase